MLRRTFLTLSKLCYFHIRFIDYFVNLMLVDYCVNLMLVLANAAPAARLYGCTIQYNQASHILSIFDKQQAPDPFRPAAHSDRFLPVWTDHFKADRAAAFYGIVETFSLISYIY